MHQIPQPTLPHEIWTLVFPFVPSWKEKLNLLQLCKPIYHGICASNEEYQLKHLLQAFTGYCSMNVAPKQFFVPSVAYIRCKAPRLQQMVTIQEEEVETSEETAPQIHFYFTPVLLNIPKYLPCELVQDALLELMKYLPWEPKPLLEHPFAKIQAMAKIGAQLADLHAKNETMSRTEVEQIVSNFEDYASCITYRDYSFMLFGQQLVHNTGHWDEKMALAACRSHWFSKPKSATTVTFSNPEIIAFFLYFNKNLDLIDPKLFASMEFLQQTMLKNPSIMQYAPTAVKDDESVFLYAKSKKRAQVILHMSHALQSKYLQEYIYAIPFEPNYRLPKEWNDNEHVALAAIEWSMRNFSNASDRLRNSYDFVLQVVQIKPDCYSYVPDAYKISKEIIRTALQKNIHLVHSVPKTFVESNALLSIIAAALTMYRQKNRFKSKYRSFEAYAEDEGIVIDWNTL